MFGQPALVPSYRRSDSQSKALLAQQRIAPVAAAIGHDLVFRGLVQYDGPLGIAGPALADLVGIGPRLGIAAGVNAPHEVALSQDLEHLGTHAGHDSHRADDVRGIRHLNTDLGEARVHRAHAEGYHVHYAAPHAGRKSLGDGLLVVVGRDPVTQRSHHAVFCRRHGLALEVGADEGPALDPSHVGRVGSGQPTVNAKK